MMASEMDRSLSISLYLSLSLSSLSLSLSRARSLSLTLSHSHTLSLSLSLSVSLSLSLSVSVSLRLSPSLSLSFCLSILRTHPHIRLRQDLFLVVQGGVGTEVNEFRGTLSDHGEGKIGRGGGGADVEMAMYMTHRAHEVGMKAEDDSVGGFGEGGEEGFEAEGGGSLGFGFGQGLRGLWQAHTGNGETGTHTLSPGNPGSRPRSQSLKNSLFSAAAPFSLLTSRYHSFSKVTSAGISYSKYPRAMTWKMSVGRLSSSSSAAR
jgi:hypothetical protein